MMLNVFKLNCVNAPCLGKCGIKRLVNYRLLDVDV